MKETEWLDSIGARKANYRFESVDCKGVVHEVRPDLMIGTDDETWIVEYKNGNCLTTTGIRGGKVSAENAKARYDDLTDQLVCPNARAKRNKNSRAHLGWNHTLGKMIGMDNSLNEHTFVCPDTNEQVTTGKARVMIVDPLMAKHRKSKAKDKVSMFKHASKTGIEFYSTDEFALMLDSLESPYQW
ncbi:hypothetical protein E2K93_09955 [Thalassotalea sp. HSM 43]|uniref:hypothetical protein n=1 Tax=Thalassotalea sp. HSM 43 TaxID=2552945 RepID=UPI0010819833|nr:hypothetical protein [Thalassotalea sp. HSM 43]QBY04694.1 hypothetical protein E2K93_09955 [Thalassotalea sp. HSM 43]